MIAPPMPSAAASGAPLDSGAAVRPGRRPRRAGFTLTELLVVIAIIVLLMGVLLVALGKAREKSFEVDTLSRLQAFTNACDNFYQDHGFYPGVIPENILAAHASASDVDSNPATQITSMSNALLHLMGGYTREEDVSAADFNNAPGVLYTLPNPAGGTYRIKVDRNSIGNGPIINGKSYAPYFSPDDSSFVIDTDGSTVRWWTGGAGAYTLPHLVDKWDNPILYLRRARQNGVLASLDGSIAQFDLRTAVHYVNAFNTGRIESGGTPETVSIIQFSGTSTQPALNNFARLLQHPALDGQARGAYMVLSAGADGTYYAAADGAGDTSNPVWDISDQTMFPASILNEYDDIVVFGGS